MRLTSLFVAVTSMVVLAVTASAAEKVKLENIKCVMNSKNAAKETKFVEFKAGKVFFCCDNCPKAFVKELKAGNKMVLAKGNHQLVATGQAKQSKCPFSGQTAKSETAIEVAGAKIAFCCENCQAKAKKMEGDEQLVGLFGNDAYIKAGFEVKKDKDSDFTSEGASDPTAEEKKDQESDFTSEGAEDPSKDEKNEESSDFTSEGADDPNDEGDGKEPELNSDGAEEPDKDN